VSSGVGIDEPTTTDVPRRISSERIALWVFVAYLVVALPVLLWLGSDRWFLGDEWTILTDRSLNVDDLFRPNNQHWSTVLVLVYRAIFSVVGLHAYWPYQVVVIVMHLATAGLLRVAMRRALVAPWLATVAAGAFVLLGPAEDNILWAIQIGLTTTVVLGLGQMLLADHDGPIDRRDWWGLGLGAVALMTSGNAPPLIAAAGLVCLFRRRWAAAAFHTVPLGAAYLVWFLVYDVRGSLAAATRSAESPFSFGAYARWMTDAGEGFTMALGHFTPIAVLLVALLVGGTTIAWRTEGGAAFLCRASVPTALLVAAVLAMTSAAPGRYFIPGEPAKGSRYLGLLVAFALPALAVAGDALIRRWRGWAPAVFAVFLIPIPFNAAAFGDNSVLTPETFSSIRLYVTALPDHPLVAETPGWVRPAESALGYPDMTVGWLRQADRNGVLPDPDGELNPLILRVVPLQLGVAVVDDDPPEEEPEGLRCATHTEPLALDPAVGDRLAFQTAAQVAGRSGGEASTLWRAIEPSTVEITLPDLQILLAPVEGETEFRVCRG
jgi:hypothetical protein